MRSGTAPLRWGVVGATSFVAQRAVLPALRASARAEVVALASRSGGGSTEPYRRVLEDPAVEIVYIPLPNSMHREWVERSLSAGKHVLCEKPLGVDGSDVAAMQDAAARSGRILLEAYMTPFHPRSEALASLVASEELGSLRFARACFTGRLERHDDYRWHAEMGGGALLDVGIYVLAPLLAAGGAPERWASCSVVSNGVDSSFAGWARFTSGLAGSFECSFEAPERQELELVGTRGALVLERAFTPGAGEDRVVIHRVDGTLEEVHTGGGDCYLAMVDHVFDVVRTGASPRHGPRATRAIASFADQLRAASEGRDMHATGTR